MFTPFQIIFCAVLIMVFIWQGSNIQIVSYATVVIIGWLVGLVMGDVTTGMLIGGNLCLMSFGLVPAGGSSVPNYNIGCMAGAAFAIAMGQTGDTAVATALAVGVPVAALCTQLDVVGKMSGSFFIHRAIAASDKKDWKGVGFWVWASQLVLLPLYAIPMILLMTIGSGVVETLVNAFPAWLTNGLSVASGVLPTLGFALLLHTMPLKKYGYFLIIGYVLAAYLDLSVLAIALIAVVICMYVYQDLERQDKVQEQIRAAGAAALAGGDMEDE